MPVVDVVNLDGKKVGQVELADAIFGAKVNQHLLHEASRWYLRGLRRGTHKVKEKSEVSGAGRKLWKQKGTGRARVGSIRSPLWRHGGTVHGPKPRDYSYALPKKMLLGALRSALSAKLAEQKLTVVDAWALETHKTKSLLAVLGKLNHTKSALLVAHGENANLERASRGGAGRGNDCSRGKAGEKGSGAKGGNKETGGSEESREAGKEKGEGIEDVDPSLSNHSAADHHGKGPRRERDAAHRGV